MLNNAIEILKEITSKGYQAYIVGGFVRDYLLNFESKDIDISTDASPRQIKELFEDAIISNQEYGSVTLYRNSLRYEITTFRIEKNYINHRTPTQIEYIKDLISDLKRRDFTINTLCIDENKNVIDKLNGKEDLNNKIIRCVGDAQEKISEDSLRILRAIRFATILDFKLDDELKKAIINNKESLKLLSYNRKKEELDKIFASSNSNKGVQLLIELGLDKELEINNLNKVNINNPIGIWAILDVCDIYPFTRLEKDQIENIQKVLKYDNKDPYILYKYGLYVNTICATIKSIDTHIINEIYENMPIHTRKEINIEPIDIIRIFDKKPGKYIKDIYTKIEKNILHNRLNNKKCDIIKYIENIKE